jgi:hypothetical protein
MHTDRTVDPTPEQIALVLAYPEASPFVMVNLLKFRGLTGAKLYWDEYAPRVTPLAEGAGGVTLWKGRAEHLIIGGPPNDWDAVWLVRWPSKTHFLTMMNHPDFPATQEVRVRALERMALLLTSEQTPGPSPA